MKLPYYHTWQRLEDIVSEMEAEVTKAKTPKELLAKFAKPTKTKLDFEAIRKEQNYPRYDSKRADELVKEMNIQEPIEDLLNMI